MSSTALILRPTQTLARQNNRAQSPAHKLYPGRTLNEFYDSLGSVAEKTANRAAHSFGLGPLAVAGRITRYFDTGGEHERERKIYTLHHSQACVGKLKRDCSKLLYYASPTHSADTQMDAFNCIIDFTTRYPGLRHFFLESRSIRTLVKQPVSLDGLRALWKPQYHGHDNGDELDFFVGFASACLVDSDITSLVEANLVENARVEGYHGGLTVVEKLLVAFELHTPTESNAFLPLRYIGGILELPSFWLQSGQLFDTVLRKIAHAMSQILRDLDVEQASDNTTELVFADLDGLDIVLSAFLSGIHGFIIRCNILGILQDQEWFQDTFQLVSLLRYPRAEAFLPSAYVWANSSRFQRWFSTPYQVRAFAAATFIQTSTEATDCTIPHASIGATTNDASCLSDRQDQETLPTLDSFHESPNSTTPRRRTFHILRMLKFVQRLSFLRSRRAKGHPKEKEPDNELEQAPDPSPFPEVPSPPVPASNTPTHSLPRPPENHIAPSPLSVTDTNPVGRFHEYTQKTNQTVGWEYSIEMSSDEKGAVTTWTVTLLLDGNVVGSGVGRSKKAGRRAAAEKALGMLVGEMGEREGVAANKLN
ncbi:hypothetical protein MIND_00656700 [Mycena indigotica]|uniref:DRBM domain-containing protein n=1 Tax=Mycena indigotica TaxID=2126181 RepID=A0A8H6SL10_9AGAR|nr:uncharacterized protein MIND_00656700 [Mycena indigotica]KAF7300938.1 hypothetical protein MIND_00656700 [Mycena indigotica]